ncbi:MAG TPA: hypothetical protein EYG02_10230 [Henriciella marina]|uniref:hypothetical protein n=1 Tax=Henriciella sp. TaxID=1968823 RepID=UPI00183DEDFD|nr:hypothetical protein [Henriciella sp.]HIG23952.1 hypothetical protein [Henriciella sp.]HIK65390.1 hypothetical protein [Henriciella marina]
MSNPKSANRPVIAIAIATFGLVAIMMGFAIAKKTGAMNPDLARRGAAAMIGLVLVVTGNFVPKLRLFQPKDGAPGASAVDRFAGWVFVACGAAFTAVWLFAPIDKAMLGSPMIGVAGFLLVLARWLAWKGNRTTGLMPRFTPGRFAIVLLLISILWVFAIFFADATWGDSVAQWMAIGFTIAVAAMSPVIMLWLRRAGEA